MACINTRSDRRNSWSVSRSERVAIPSVRVSRSALSSAPDETLAAAVSGGPAAAAESADVTKEKMNKAVMVRKK